MTAEQIRRDELRDWLDGIAAFNATPGEGITRGVYTPEFEDARRYVIGEMQKLGLTVREDCLGNIFGEETVTENLYSLLPVGAPVIMMALSLLFCAIQAMVYSMLTSSYLNEFLEE